MPSGSVRMSSYPLAAHTKASAIPVLPLVASTIVVTPSSMSPCALGGLDHRDADAVLDAAAQCGGAATLANSSTSADGARRASLTTGVPCHEIDDVGADLAQLGDTLVKP